MRLERSLLIFAVLVFALGWTSSLLADRFAAAPVRRSCAGRSEGAGQESMLGCLERFITELSTSAEQRAELQAVVTAARGRVELLERGICQEHREAKVAVAELLTEKQHAALEQRMDERWAAYRARRLAALDDWLAARGRPEDRSLVQEILHRHEEERAAYFRRIHREQASFPSRESLQQRLGEIEAGCDDRLARWLDHETRRELWDFYHSWEGRRR